MMFLNQFLSNPSQSPYGQSGVPMTAAAPNLAAFMQQQAARGGGMPMGMGAMPANPMPQAQPNAIQALNGQNAQGQGGVSPLQLLLSLSRQQQNNQPGAPNPNAQAVALANQPNAAGMTGISDHGGLDGLGIGNSASPGISTLGMMNANQLPQYGTWGAMGNWLSSLFGGAGAAGLGAGG